MERPCSEARGRARKPDVYADGAYAVLNKPVSYTGHALLCEDVCWNRVAPIPIGSAT
ncbi:hypothetical protein MALGJ_07370 [Mycolicibacter algericus]|uniref:Uncharacterized protein n=1 Tax=Mycolicibacter algericus TaxID=1288388 RepID=A0A7I9Y5X6_MYCAL|nr:hypothetical protein MALGJ_07370 [Mycolicibacter algericus]